MNYTGRITLFSMYLAVLLTELLLGKDFNWGDSIGDILFAILAWGVGSIIDRLRFLSFNDFLTQVHNRRYGDKIIPKLLNKAKLREETLTIFSIDVNNFKSLNDRYGHGIGDLALKKLSEILVNYTRRNDAIIRWGGDEFLIVSPNVNKEDALPIVERINKAVELEVSKIKDENIQLGISIGFSTFPYDGHTFDELLSCADKKMYSIKFQKKTVG